MKGKTPRETAELIYRENIVLINSVQAIIADISPFRGPNMDPGTAWEIGYGIAKGLPVLPGPRTTPICTSARFALKAKVSQAMRTKTAGQSRTLS